MRERLYLSVFEGPSVLERQPGDPLEKNQLEFTGQRQAEWHPLEGLLGYQAGAVHPKALRPCSWGTEPEHCACAGEDEMRLPVEPALENCKG